MYVYTVATLVGIYCILTLGLNTITGIAGQISLGHAGFLVLVVAGVLLTLAVNLWLLHSWAGLALLATREDEDAAHAAGVDVRAFKIMAFTIGTALAGLAGSFYAHYLTFISAGDFGFPFSITILCMLVLGGIGTNPGAIVGAVILGVLPELSRPLAEYRMRTYGALLLVLMRWAPPGLLGDASLLGRPFARRPAA